MLGISAHTDDCLYFSDLLASVISEHGLTLAAKLGASAPKAQKFDSSRVRADGTMPDGRNYPDFEEVFRPKPPQDVVNM
jgi:hypothetical protein